MGMRRRDYSRPRSARAKMPLTTAIAKTAGWRVGGSDPKFDPATFRVTEPRSFDDLKVGEIFRTPSRTVTETHFAAFQVLSGDNHPIHYDAEYCRRHGHRGLLAHGLQVAAFAAIGAGLFPHQIGEKLIGFIE